MRRRPAASMCAAAWAPCRSRPVTPLLSRTQLHTGWAITDLFACARGKYLLNLPGLGPSYQCLAVSKALVGRPAATTSNVAASKHVHGYVLCSSASAGRLLAASQCCRSLGNRDKVYLLANPYNTSHLGGEALEASTSAAKQAAAEACTGAWLRELEEALAAGAPPPRVCAPGLPRGAFGAWAVPDAGRPPGTL